MSENTERKESSRRAFLRAASVTAAASAVGIARADEATAPAAEAKADTSRILELKDFTDLQKVGGSKVVENGKDKIIVARTGENDFVACSAICTHRGCTIEYFHEDKQFICPCHGARFDLQGNVVKGPAKKPLARHEIEAAAILELVPAPTKAP